MGQPCRGGNTATADGHLVEPAASRIAGRSVEPADVRLDVDDRCAVDEIDAREVDPRASEAEDLDKAEPDGIDPAWPPGGEDADPPLLASQQERNLPQRR